MSEYVRIVMKEKGKMLGTQPGTYTMDDVSFSSIVYISARQKVLNLKVLIKKYQYVLIA